MTNERKTSFWIVGAVYLIAAAVGVISYVLLLGKLPFWLNLLVADIIATIVTFAFSVILKNASVYDPYWSVQPIVIAVAWLIVKPTVAVAVCTAAVCLWGVRLTANWAYTFHGLSHQDWRYTMLKEKTGRLYPFVNFTGIHLVPTLVVYGCVLPVVFLAETGASFNPVCLVFVALTVFAVCLQGVSDVQMHKFRKAKAAGKASGFIRTGLWKYARHPNYLGEILTWWGIALAAFVCMPDKWYLLSGAVANTLLFVFISVPLADGKMKKREGFAEYKKQTRVFLPIPKFRADTSAKS
ncbi:MAG: DUF1295 domain-containing protein [Clostridia bacterium]|nr:DUF1295 domain-containing protein [Clostridia bacterium]